MATKTATEEASPIRNDPHAGSLPVGAGILVVDDDDLVRHLIGRVLKRGGYTWGEASDAAEARARLATEHFELVICDVKMPGESGLDLIQDLLAADRDIGVLMASGNDDPAVAEIATERGAYGYLIKPFSPNQLLIEVGNALARRHLECENRDFRRDLERTVERRTAELTAKIEELRHSQEETVRRLSRAVALRDNDTGEHTERIGMLSVQLGQRLGLASDRLELLGLASPLHDVGKIAVPDHILLKPGLLTEDERAQMQRHTVIGHQILAESESELLKMADTIALTHHEKFDGSGYPDGLAGEEIPIEGRIVAVADVFDALVSDRVYRPAHSVEKALAIMREGRGTHFDPLALDAFLRGVDDAPVAVAH